MARLDYICQLNMGQSPDSTSYNDKGKGLPFFQGNADFGIKHPTVRVWCDAPTKIAHAGDVLISVRAPIGALNIALEDCCIGRGLAALTVHEHLCNKGYLWHAIASKVDELNAKGTGSTFKAISKNVLAETEIPMPDLSEQEHIARVLDEVDTLISLRKQQIAKLDELVKARFIELFGTVTKNPYGFPMVTLKEVCHKITDGKHGGCEQEADSGYYYVGAREIYDDSIHYDTAPQITYADFAKDYKRCNIERGDMVIVNTGATIGKTAIATSPLTDRTLLQKSVALLKVKKEIINAEFLRHCYMANPSMYKVESASAQPNLLLSEMNATCVYLPPIGLQEQFAAFVAQTDQRKLTIQHSLAQLELLKKALMQKYFG